MISPRKILLIRPDHLGDVILSLPVAEALKRSYPESQVFYLAASGPAQLQILADYVDGWIIDENSNGKPKSLLSLLKSIREIGIDTMVELKPSWRTAAAGYFSRIPLRIGTSRRFYSFFYNHNLNLHRRASGRHQTDLELAMLEPLNIKVQGLFPNLKINNQCLSKASLLTDLKPKSYVIIHPGSSGSSPNWPLGNYIELAKTIASDTEYKVVITGLASDIGPDFDQYINLCGKTDLEALAGLISGAALFISGSTGPLHLADSLGAKCISFFVNHPDIGPDRWGPRRNMTSVLMPEKSCHCPRLSNCHCLEQVTLDIAFNKIGEALRLRECGPIKQ